MNTGIPPGIPCSVGVSKDLKACKRPTIAADRIAGIVSGKVTVRRVLRVLAPDRYAASSSDESMVANAGKTITYISGTMDKPNTHIIAGRENALIVVLIPKFSARKLFRIPPRGANRNIHAMLSAIGGIRRGMSGMISIRPLKGVLVLVVIQANAIAVTSARTVDPAA